MKGKRHVKRISEGVRKYFGIDLYNFWMTKDRSSEIIYARQVAMYLASHQEGVSLTCIGKEFHRHHSTVISSVRKIASEIKIYKETKEEVHYLKKTLRVKEKNA